MRALRFIPALLLLACGLCRGEEKKSPEEAPLVSPKKSFSIISKHDEATGFIDKLQFAAGGNPGELVLPPHSYPGSYYISPDDRWILRLQQICAGYNEAILYHVEDNQRISEVMDFDKNAWRASDAVSSLKRSELEDTGVIRADWAVDSAAVTFRVIGKSADRSYRFNGSLVTYHIAKNSFTAKPLPDDPAPQKKRN